MVNLLGIIRLKKTSQHSSTTYYSQEFGSLILQRYSMRGFYLVVVALLFLSNVQAQSTTPALKVAPELQIIEQKWQVEYRNPALDEDPLLPNNILRQAQIDRRENDRQNAIRAKRGQPPEPPPAKVIPVETRRADPWIRYTYRLKIKNTSQKPIVRIHWDYVFYELGTEHEIGRQRFTSENEILPDKIKNLVMRSPAPPTKTVNVNESDKLENKYSEKIEIIRIEYKDGSVWEATPLK